MGFHVDGCREVRVELRIGKGCRLVVPLSEGLATLFEKRLFLGLPLFRRDRGQAAEDRGWIGICFFALNLPPRISHVKFPPLFPVG